MSEQEPAIPDEVAAAGVAQTPGEPAEPERTTTRRNVTLLVTGSLLAVGLLVAMLLPLPYAVERPGPTVNTLGEHDGEPLIEVDGAETYPTEGELRLTTVSVVGGPGYPVTAFDAVYGWLRSDQVVLPAEAVFPEDATQEQLDEQSSQQMASSQTNATVAALEELGYDISMVLTVSGVAESSGAAGIVENGDVITAIQAPGQDRVEVGAFSDLASVLREVPPEATVMLEVSRDGESTDLEVETMSAGPDTKGSVLGVFLQPDIELPFEVSFDIDDIGGPSAGTMFALGIIDVLTEDELTGGESIAGTGTLDLAGQVGTIGGIRQKLVGASNDGADWFLAPEGNCDEVVGHVPDGLRVVSVTTLEEARDAVEAIAADGADGLPTCTSGE